MFIEELISFSVNNRSVILVLHALAGAVGVGSAVVLDVLFFSFLRDRVIKKDESKIARVVAPIFMYALALLYVSGLFLFLSDVARYSESTKFLTKLLIVAVLTVNGYVLHFYITPRLHKLIFYAHDFAHRRLAHFAFACGAVSLPSWILAYILGTMQTLPIPLWVAILAYCVVVTGAVAISQLVLYKLTLRR